MAPSKSYIVASNKQATVWLNRTWWEHIKARIEVVKDVSDIGARLATGNSATSSTIDKRREQAMQQLRGLRFCPAIVEAKAKAILAKVYAPAFYGIEAAEVPVAKIASLIAAIIDVLRSRNDNHTVDSFF